MERFTKRDKYGNPYTDSTINDRFMWSKDGKIWERDLSQSAFDGKAIDKLCLLEDIEEELGIDLITLFKAFRNGIYVIESNDGYIVEDCICSIEHFKDGWGIVTNNEELELLMSDYGKTWALTREELDEE